MRTVLGATGIAAFSALVAAIVHPPGSAYSVTTTYAQPPAVGGPGTVVTVQPPILYVQLQPGQTAPPGAKVISSSPAPVASVAPVPKAVQTPIIVRTTQSGKVIP